MWKALKVKVKYACHKIHEVFVLFDLFSDLDKSSNSTLATPLSPHGNSHLLLFMSNVII